VAPDLAYFLAGIAVVIAAMCSLMPPD